MRIIKENILHEDTSNTVIMRIRENKNNNTDNKVIEIFNKIFSLYVLDYEVLLNTHDYTFHFSKEQMDTLGIGEYASHYVEEYLEFIEESVKIGNYDVDKIKEDYEKSW